MIAFEVGYYALRSHMIKMSFLFDLASFCWLLVDAHYIIIDYVCWRCKAMNLCLSTSTSDLQLRLVSEITRLAGFFHDLGKETTGFQKKLKAGKRVADPIRHEYVSYLMLRALSGAGSRWEDGLDDNEFLSILADEQRFRRQYSAVFKRLQDEKTALETLLKKWPQRESDWLQSRYRIYLPSDQDGKRRTLLRALGLIVLSHHRLPHGMAWRSKEDGDGVDVTLTIQEYVNKSTIKTLGNMFRVNPKKESLASDPEWIQNVGRTADRISSLLGSDSTLHNLDYLAFFYGRTPLILGDHRYSRLPSQRSCEGQGNIVYANTSRTTGQLNQPLAEHLVGVGDMAHAVSHTFLNHSSTLPHTVVPDHLINPQVEKDSPFEWQVEARDITARKMKGKEEAGFFGLVMAGTGCGKTRAIPLIMNAASGGKLRYSLSLGLRTLTLQSADEYRDGMGFPEGAVSVVLGSEIAEKLHRLRNEEDYMSVSEDGGAVLDVGTDAEDIDVSEIVYAPEGEGEKYRLSSPFDQFFLEDEKSNQVLARPILISTIDTLMSLADARYGGRHVTAWSRVSTSDLVLDEIDDYSPEDIVAISRLVFHTGAYGRRLLISSATISPVLAKSLYETYMAGYQKYCDLHGKRLNVTVGWYSEHKGISRVHDVNDVGIFEHLHHQVSDAITESLINNSTKRRATIKEIGDTSKAEDYFGKVWEAVSDLHQQNHIRVESDSGTKRVSLGVVRWNNVEPSIRFAEYLLSSPPKDHLLRLVCYNGTLTQVVRFHTENLLDRMLKRKHLLGEVDPALRYPSVLDAIRAAGNQHQDVVILVTTTSMEEVGRDHDFDWAITEPGSVRSVIQMAGRVRRHRPPASGDAANLTLLDETFKDHRYRWGEGARAFRQDPFSYPGVETPVFPSQCRINGTWLSTESRRAQDVYNMALWNRTVDAQEVVSETSRSSPLAHAENAKLAAYLGQSVHSGQGNSGDFAAAGVGNCVDVSSWHRSLPMIACNYHPKMRIFRRSGTSARRSLVLEMQENDIRMLSEASLKGGQVSLTRHGKQMEKIYLPEKSTDMLLPKIPDIQKAFVDLARRIMGNKYGRGSALMSLLSFELSARDEDTIRIHPLLGAYRKRQ